MITIFILQNYGAFLFKVRQHSKQFRLWGVCSQCCVAKAFQRCQRWEDTEENDLEYSRLSSLCAEEVTEMAHWEENGDNVAVLRSDRLGYEGTGILSGGINSAGF